MLRITAHRLGSSRSWACSLVRLYSSNSKPPRLTRRKGKSPTKNQEPTKIKTKFAPSMSELLEDFLTHASAIKNKHTDSSNTEAVETMRTKEEKTHQKRPKIISSTALQDKNIIKSMDLLRDFMNMKDQPSIKSAKPTDRLNRRSVRIRHTENLPEPAKLNLFDEKSLQEYSVDESVYKNSVFNEITLLEASAYRAKSTHSHFEELIQWTLDGKLWKFPINNEQDWTEELNTPFHEHVFLSRLLKNKSAGTKNPAPLKAFMDLVCAGLGQNPYISAQQKREHLAWFEGYFASKIKDIEAAVEEEKRIAEAEAKAREIKP